MRFTARPRMGGRRAVGRRCRGGPRRDRPLMGSRPRPPPEGEGGDEIGFSRDLCVCICTKVVCVSIDLTCFCWEVFWGWTFFWELSSFGNFLLFLSSLFARRRLLMENRPSEWSSSVRWWGSLRRVAERRASLGIC